MGRVAPAGDGGEREQRTDQRAARVAIGLVIPALLVAASVVPELAAWSKLPEPLAVRFAPGGDPDGTLSKVGELAFTGLLSLVPGIVVASTLLGREPLRPSARGVVSVSFAAATLAAAVSVLVVVANAGAPAWPEARRLGLAGLLLPLAFGALGALLGWWATGSCIDDARSAGGGAE